MTGRGVLGHMGGQHEEGAVHLKRRIGQGAQKLRLCFLLKGHQIKNQYLQRPDILSHGPVLVHYEYIF